MAGFKQAVLGVLGGILMAEATVEDIEVVNGQFRLITLSSEKFKTATMQPASKIRLNSGDWELRAYTPLSMDAATGRIQFLAYLHGHGPGSTWAQAVVPGARTHVLGPQQSLDLSGLSRPAVFFGDETSFAAAKTLQSHLSPHHAARFVFEVASAAGVQAIVDRLELGDVELYERQANDAHLPRVTAAIEQALAGTVTPHLVLTGNGRSIQAIRAILRNQHSASINYHVKAYWAPGKTGLE